MVYLNNEIFGLILADGKSSVGYIDIFAKISAHVEFETSAILQFQMKILTGQKLTLVGTANCFSILQ